METMPGFLYNIINITYNKSINVLYLRLSSLEIPVILEILDERLQSSSLNVQLVCKSKQLVFSIEIHSLIGLFITTTTTKKPTCKSN
jgi:hypothetical protein